MSIAKRPEKRAIIPAKNQDFLEKSFRGTTGSTGRDYHSFRRNPLRHSDLIDPQPQLN
jgi:hypothetical protein